MNDRQHNQALEGPVTRMIEGINGTLVEARGDEKYFFDKYLEVPSWPAGPLDLKTTDKPSGQWSISGHRPGAWASQLQEPFGLLYIACYLLGSSSMLIGRWDFAYKPDLFIGPQSGKPMFWFTPRPDFVRLELP